MRAGVAEDPAAGSNVCLSIGPPIGIAFHAASADRRAFASVEVPRMVHRRFTGDSGGPGPAGGFDGLAPGPSRAIVTFLES